MVRSSPRGARCVVSINYRLGVLGYMAHPALKCGIARRRVTATTVCSTGSAALEWVEGEYRRAFGGDANNVTIAGESSRGALSCDVSDGVR